MLMQIYSDSLPTNISNNTPENDMFMEVTK